MNLSTATPVEIDTVLAEIWGRINAVNSQIAAQNDKIRMAQKAMRQGYKHYADMIPAAQARIEELKVMRAPIEAEAEPYEAEYRRRPWTRAFLVTNSNGHVHKDMHCGTCFITTQYAWMIDYSGKSEAEIVDAAGCMACTVCYPSAPVEALARPTRMFASEEDRIKAEKKAAAEATQCAGSGTWDYPRETARQGYCSGNYGVCSHCNKAITISSTGKMRKHQAA